MLLKQEMLNDSVIRIKILNWALKKKLLKLMR